MVRDKSMGILLMVLFGLPGLAVMVMAWLQPFPGMERILSTLAGVIGLSVALVQGLRLRSARPGMVKVEVAEKP